MLVVAFLAALLVLVLILPPLSWLHGSNDDGWRFRPTLLIAGASLALVRLGCYWYLLHLEATGQQTPVTALLGLTLLPELLLATPYAPELTFARKLLFGVLLTAGSFLWALVVALPCLRRSRARG